LIEHLLDLGGVFLPAGVGGGFALVLGAVDIVFGLQGVLGEGALELLLLPIGSDPELLLDREDLDLGLELLIGGFAWLLGLLELGAKLLEFGFDFGGVFAGRAGLVAVVAAGSIPRGLYLLFFLAFLFGSEGGVLFIFSGGPLVPRLKAK
jgi:hypothetical protein